MFLIERLQVLLRDLMIALCPSNSLFSFSISDLNKVQPCSLCVLKYVPRKWNNLVRFRYLLKVICLFQGTQIDILETVQNLLKHCSNPTSFLKPLAKLFSVIQNKLSRNKLCLVFQVLHFYIFLCIFKICSKRSTTK